MQTQVKDLIFFLNPFQRLQIKTKQKKTSAWQFPSRKMKAAIAAATSVVNVHFKK